MPQAAAPSPAPFNTTWPAPAQTPCQTLRAFSRDGRLVKGQFLSASADTVLLDLGDGAAGRIALESSALERIEARHRATKRRAYTPT